MPGIGEGNAHVTNIRNIKDPILGDSHEIDYEGTQAGINDVIATWSNTPGVRIRSQKPGEHAAVTITLPFAEGGTGEEAPTVVVEKVVNRIQKDILDSELGQSISDEDKEKIRKAIQNPDPASSPALTDPNSINLYAWMLAGVTHKIVYQDTFRVTTTAAPGYAYPTAHAGVGQIWTKAQMLGGGSVPFFLPEDTVEDADGYQYGWLKHSPQYTLTVGQRMTEILEWEYGKWPVDLYTAYAP